jgi:hypothetical protein
MAGIPGAADGGRARGAPRAVCAAAPGFGPVASEGRPRRGDRERPGTYTLAVRVMAALYPPLTNQRRWAFQSAMALSRRHLVIRAAARWDKLDEATVTIECQARDAAAAVSAAQAMIRQTARRTGQINIRDIEVTRVTLAG